MGLEYIRGEGIHFNNLDREETVKESAPLWVSNRKAFDRLPAFMRDKRVIAYAKTHNPGGLTEDQMRLLSPGGRDKVLIAIARVRDLSRKETSLLSDKQRAVYERSIRGSGGILARPSTRRLAGGLFVMVAGLGLVGCGMPKPGDSETVADKAKNAVDMVKEARNRLKKDPKEEAEKMVKAQIAADHFGNFIKDQISGGGNFYREQSPESAKQKLKLQIMRAGKDGNGKDTADYLADLPNGMASLDAAIDAGMRAVWGGKDPDTIASAASSAAADDRWVGRQWFEDLKGGADNREESSKREKKSLLDDWNYCEDETVDGGVNLLALRKGRAEFDFQAVNESRKIHFSDRKIPGVYRFEFNEKGAWSQPMRIIGKSYASVVNVDSSANVEVAWQIFSKKTGEPVRKKGMEGDEAVKMDPKTGKRKMVPIDMVAASSVIRSVNAQSEQEDFVYMMERQFGKTVAEGYRRGEYYVSCFRVRAPKPAKFTLLLENPKNVPGFEAR